MKQRNQDKTKKLKSKINKIVRPKYKQIFIVMKQKKVLNYKFLKKKQGYTVRLYFKLMLNRL
jgi:hypothetical protein